MTCPDYVYPVHQFIGIPASFEWDDVKADIGFAVAVAAVIDTTRPEDG